MPIANLTQINYVPGATGNNQNLNEFVIDPNGAMWFIDFEGKAKNLQITGADIEVTESDKGFIQQSPDGSRWRLTVNDDGVLHRDKI